MTSKPPNSPRRAAAGVTSAGMRNTIPSSMLFRGACSRPPRASPQFSACPDQHERGSVQRQQPEADWVAPSSTPVIGLPVRAMSVTSALAMPDTPAIGHTTPLVTPWSSRPRHPHVEKQTRALPQLCLVVGEVPSTQGGDGRHGLRTVKPVPAWQRLGGYWFRPAVTPPSTSQIAPVTQPAWSERRKVATAETSSVVPIRPIGWKSLNPARTVSTSAGGMKPS
jgi:hypothetical protein